MLDDIYAASLISTGTLPLYPASVDLADVSAAIRPGYHAVAPTVPLGAYTNTSNIYSTILQNWLAWADANTRDRESAFFHYAAQKNFNGTSGSSQPVRYWWQILRISSGGTVLNVYSPTAGGVTFGAAVGDYLTVGYIDKFREVDLTFTTAAAGGFAGVWEYPSAVDGSKNPTAWTAFTPASDGTSGLTVNGNVVFDDATHLLNPPVCSGQPAWLPCVLNAQSACNFYVRFRTTHTGTTPVAASCYSQDYTGAGSGQAGTTPAWDSSPTADADGDNYLNPVEYASRATGKDARFKYQSRALSVYGQMRFLTRPANANFQTWVVVFQTANIANDSTIGCLTMDNSDPTAVLPSTVTLIESAEFTTWAADYGSLLGTLWAAIAPVFIMPNIGNGASAGSTLPTDGVTKACRAGFCEFVMDTRRADRSRISGMVNDSNRRYALSPSPQALVYDSTTTAAYGNNNAMSSRWQLSTLSLYYILCNPPFTYLDFGGGDTTTNSWQRHWCPAAGLVNIGTPNAIAAKLQTLVTDTSGVSVTPTLSTSTTGGSIADNTTYYFKTSRGNSANEGFASSAASVATGNSGSNTNTITVSLPGLSGQTPGYRVYASTDNVNFFLQGAAQGVSITLVNDPDGSPSVIPTGGGATGGLLAAGTYYCKWSNVNALGETLPGEESVQFTVAAGNIPQITINSPPTNCTNRVYLTLANGASGSEVRYKSGQASGTILLDVANTGTLTPAVANTCNPTTVTLTSLLFSGTKPQSTNLAPVNDLWGRDFTLGYVLYRPIPSSTGGRSGTFCDDTAITVSLPGSYRPVHVDGTLGGAVGSVSIRNAEGIIFLK